MSPAGTTELPYSAILPRAGLTRVDYLSRPLALLELSQEAV